MNKKISLYYLAPPNEQFQELKEKAIELWRELDYGNYANEKIEAIKGLENIRDNFLHIVAMFDYFNQIALASKLSEGTRKAIRDRMKAGGATRGYIVF